MAKKFGLGKGLEALLPAGISAKTEFGTGEALLPIANIAPNPGQPRKFFDETALDELAASIREHGVLQPIIVEETGGDILNGGLSGGSYTIIAGERRYRAACRAGLTAIPAIIRSFTDEKRLAVSIIENIQRADLNPIEEVAAYKSLIDLTGMSQDEAAAKLGTKRSTLANALRLLKLPPAMQNALISAEMSAGHARAILSLAADVDRETLFSRILGENLNVRQAERLAAEIGGGLVVEEAPAAPPDSAPQVRPPEEGTRVRAPKDPNLLAMEQKFIEALGTKVRIDGDFAGGTVKIDYFSGDDLDRLYSIFTE
jgi:ParB family chromosome partitioning protein